MQGRRALFLLSFFVTNSAALAADNIDQINLLTQTEFRQLSEDLGAAVYIFIVDIALQADKVESTESYSIKL